MNHSNPPSGYGFHGAPSPALQTTMNPPPMQSYAQPYGSYASPPVAHPYNSAYGSAPPPAYASGYAPPHASGYAPPHASGHARGYAPPVAMDLVGKATSLAWKRLFGAVGGLALSIVITGLGAVTGFIAFIGIILFVICLIAIPFFIYGLFDPTNHGTIRRLGPNTLARQRALREIAPLLTMPDTWRVQLKAGTIYLTGGWFVYIGGWDMDVVRAEDMVWFWNKTVTHGRIFQRQSHYVAWKTRHGDKTEAAVGPHDGHVMPTLGRAFPHAIFGFDKQMERAPIANLAYEVDRRRAGAGAARQY